MASTNQSPQYQKAEGKFLAAQTNDEKLTYLDEMIRECPKHKSAEKMLAQLKTRRKKLLEKIDKGKKKGKTTKSGIKKEEMQAVIIGFTNTGKSSLISLLTNASPEIASYDFTTKKPVVGIMPFKGTMIQIIEIPAFGSEYYDKGIVNTADLVLIMITKLEQIEKIEKELDKFYGKKIIVFNIKNPTEINERKIGATLKSRRHDFIIISTKTNENIEELKNKIFQRFDKIRVYTKEPGKEKSDRPLILKPGSTIKEVAEEVLKSVKKVKETKIWGPSSKFPGQKVGLTHELKDLDVVEFRTR